MTLAPNPLPTLAEEILGLLPGLTRECRDGANLTLIAERLLASIQQVRQAAITLNADGRADLMRRKNSRQQFLVPLAHRAAGYHHCSVCLAVFERPKKSKRRTCSRACHAAYGWRDPIKAAARRRSITEAHSTPEALARIAAHNKRRWAKRGEHQRLSEQNRQQWADPVKRVLRAQSIKSINSSAEKRQFYSDLRKRQWRQDEYRKKTIAGIRESKRTPEARAKFSELLRQRWSTPKGRAIYLAGVRNTAKKMAERNKGQKQSAEHVAKRTAAARRTKAAKREGATS